MAFLPTGLVKLLGRPFTTLGLETPVGFFFEAMFRTGPWWVFLGGVQVAAALLLLIPRTAFVGALLFLPAACSIVLITWGVGFGATTGIAFGMLLSVAWLLVWDSERLTRIVRVALGLADEAYSGARAPALLSDSTPLERAGWWVGGISGMAFWLATRSLFPAALGITLAPAGVVVGALLVVVGAWRGRSSWRGRSGEDQRWHPAPASATGRDAR